jgi:hypothetical protein
VRHPIGVGQTLFGRGWLVKQAGGRRPMRRYSVGIAARGDIPLGGASAGCGAHYMQPRGAIPKVWAS